jgi:hypothetical protein
MAEVDETNAIAGAVASTDVTSVVSGSENVESSDANSVLTEGSKLAVRSIVEEILRSISHTIIRLIYGPTASLRFLCTQTLSLRENKSKAMI